MEKNRYHKYKRIFVIVADSMGIGNAPDAKNYNDEGANTFGHIAHYSETFNVPTLTELGIGLICPNTKQSFHLMNFIRFAHMFEN